MNFPLSIRGPYAVVRYIVKEEERIGSIVVPGSLDKEFIEAEIVCIGRSTVDRDLSDLQPGDRVLVQYRSYSGNVQGGTNIGKPLQFRELGMALSRDGQTYHIHPNEQIIGVYITAKGPIQ